MAKGVFTDKSHMPTQNEVSEKLSSAESSWKSMINFNRQIQYREGKWI